jgi:hypothetical protein
LNKPQTEEARRSIRPAYHGVTAKLQHFRTNNQGFEFYEKFYALPKVNIAKDYRDYMPKYWVAFDFVYPYDQRKTYDPMVVTIDKGFDPGAETNFGIN